MMKRLAATGIATAALGGALLTATPALANGDDNEVTQEKVAELNLLCNLAVLAVQKEVECGGSKSALSDEDEADKAKIHGR